MAESYNLLFNGQLSASITTLYTVPASTNTIIRAIRAVNTGNAEVTVNLYVNGTTTAHRMSPTITLAPDGEGGSMYVDDGPITLGETDTIRAVAGSADVVTITIFGLEVT